MKGSRVGAYGALLFGLLLAVVLAGCRAHAPQAEAGGRRGAGAEALFAAAHTFGYFIAWRAAWATMSV